eukprot:TRINITY_DN6420_c0_g1_i7.p3 TRINITY_DN6420_c0_g1~~TRINITY_DN6420_c0_g1_i7.p3  ORF type:complete len:181 (+),score=27.11 TRINITY_DN6420_c0_g1_i7:297-839(+)
MNQNGRALLDLRDDGLEQLAEIMKSFFNLPTVTINDSSIGSAIKSLVQFDSNLDLKELSNFQISYDFPDNRTDLEQRFDTISEAVCTEPEFEAPDTDLKPKCESPQIVISIEPVTCIKEDKKGTLECEPAKLVVRKYPGKCSFTTLPSACYIGKECKLVKTFGVTKEERIGGRKVVIPVA